MLINIKMHTLKYAYKRLLRKKNPGFWIVGSDFEQATISNIYIDLRNLDHAHIGDQMFFISAALKTSGPRITLLINKGLEELYRCFDVTTMIDPMLQEFDASPECLYVCSLKSYIHPTDEIFRRFKNILAYDLTDSEITEPLYRHIRFVLTGTLLGGDDNVMPIKTSNLKAADLTCRFGLTGKKFIIFNDILYSRKTLRRWLEPYLEAKLLALKAAGVVVVYVGGKQDQSLSSSLIGHVDIDLRGRTSFSELFALINAQDNIGFIGFDNAIMHMNLLLGKNVFIKFRGRFSQRGRKLHENVINCGVCHSAKSNITYL